MDRGLRLTPRLPGQPKAVATGVQTQSGGEGNYSCLISTLIDTPNGPKYWNTVYWIEYPNEAIAQANGNTATRTLVVGTNEAASGVPHIENLGHVARMAHCEMPDSELAGTLLQQKLREFGQGSWVANASPQKTAPPSSAPIVQAANGGRNIIPEAQSSYLHCAEWWVGLNCITAYDEEGAFLDCILVEITCIDWEVVGTEPDYGSPGGGYPVGWQSGWPAGDCDEMFELCYLGPGGQRYRINQDICYSINAPSYCADPCNTGHTMIDAPSVQMIIDRLAKESNFSMPNLIDRTEQGGWITKTGTTYTFVPFPEEWPRGPCGIGMPDNHLDFVPLNTVAVIHTQPFKAGDDTTDPSICGPEGESSYFSFHSDADYDYLYDVYERINNPLLIGIMVDLDNIIIFDLITGMFQHSQMYELCGVN